MSLEKCEKNISLFIASLDGHCVAFDQRATHLVFLKQRKRNARRLACSNDEIMYTIQCC